MIVRDEAHVIERCLRSHKDVIDYWAIVDTGSTDQTQEVIRSTMADLGIPGELHQRPWVDFGHNRTEALQFARGKADYILVNDADHVWHGELPKVLTADSYAVEYRYSGTKYDVVCLLSDRFQWKYVGVIHESVQSDRPAKNETLQGPWIEVFHEGARSRDPLTYQKDAEILAAAVEKEPTNQRYVFYLAQSYRDAGNLRDAVAMYQRRIGMAGWDQEEWYALYQIGRCYERMQVPSAMVSQAYLAAYQFRPSRAEPLARLAQYHRLRREFALAYLYAQEAALMPMTADGLFVEEGVYSWQALDELAINAWYTGHKAVGESAARAVLKRPYPPHEKPRLEANLAFYMPQAVDIKAA
jgi:glycosyltransferase involved in cell wall biosynthesis